MNFSGKDFERGWHTVHLAHADKDEIFIPVFQDVKVSFLFLKFVSFYSKEKVSNQLVKSKIRAFFLVSYF